MENKKQIKAQLRNQISKEYKDRICRAEQEYDAISAKYIAERNLRIQAEEKAASLQDELDMYKDWVRRLLEFMDMDPEMREAEIKKYKEEKELADATFEIVSNSRLFQMFNQIIGTSLF